MSKGATSLTELIEIGAVLFIIAWGMGVISPAGTLPAGQPPEDESICFVEDTTYGFNPQDIHAKGTEVDVGTYYWINGDYVGLKHDQSTITVSPKDDVVTLNVLYGDSLTAMVAADDSNYGSVPYYGTVNRVKVPCRGTYQDNAFIYKMDITDSSNQDISDLSWTAFDENDQVNSADNTNDWAIGTGIYSGQLKIKVDNDMYFSNPESDVGILLCFDAGSALANFTSVEVTSHGAKKADVPDMLLGTADWCWELTEVKSLKDGQSIYVDVDIDGDDTNEPVNGNNLSVWAVDADYYKHTDTGALEGPDYQNDQGSDVGSVQLSGTADKTIYCT